MHNLYILDAMAIIYRAYFAMARSQRITSKGVNTSAAFGFTNFLYELIKKENPSHIVVCFDSFTPTFRHKEYDLYKANREKMPEDIVSNLPYIRNIIRAFNIQLIECPGYEADDIIGTIASNAGKLSDFEVFIVTPDKDLCQIVTDNIKIYKPAHAKSPVEILDKDKVIEKFGVNNPLQVIDFLGLVGDSSDNIPGVAGVGPVAAKKLIADFGSIENIIDNINDIKNDTLRKKMEANIDNALLSKHLATIITDVPCNHNIDDFCIKKPDFNELRAICKDLEFKMFEQRLITDYSLSQMSSDTSSSLLSHETPLNTSFHPQDDASLYGGLFAPEQLQEIQQTTYNTINNTTHEYKLISSDTEIDDLINLLRTKKIFSFDTETTGLNANDCELVGFSFSVEPHKAFFVTCPSDFTDTQSIIQKFQPLFNDNNIFIIGQNLKFDLLVILQYGIKINAPIFDTMIAHYLLNPESQHGMDFLSEQYLNYKPVPIEELIGKKGLKQGNMRTVDINTLKEYAAEDADVTLQLYLKLKTEIENSDYKKLLENIELPLIKVLTNMEHTGVKIDTDFLKNYAVDMKEEIYNIENQIYDYAGQHFNISSPKQLGDILFDKLHLAEKPKKTKSGQFSTGEDILIKLQYIHPIVQCILDFRSLSKLLSTYIEPLPTLINKHTGRVHTTFNQAVVATGRLSSNNPNLQNIPIRTEKGKEIRKAFIPSDNEHVIISADYSQIELRLIAHISKDRNMQQAFLNGLDVHSATAATIFEIPIDQVDSDMRRMAKTVNFGIIYGMSPFGLAERLQISRSKASFLINQYFEKYSEIKRYMTDIVAFAKEHGYVDTIMQRRRYIKDINSANANVRGYAERNAINAPIQGSSADLIKMAMINIHEKMIMANLKSKMIIQVHDELVFDALKSEQQQLIDLVTFEMKNAVKLDIPLEVSVGVGNNWLEAH